MPQTDGTVKKLRAESMTFPPLYVGVLFGFKCLIAKRDHEAAEVSV